MTVTTTSASANNNKLIEQWFNEAFVLLNGDGVPDGIENYFYYFNEKNSNILNHQFRYEAKSEADYQKAFDLFSRILDVNSDHFPSLFFRGAANFKLKNYSGAYNDYNRALTIDGGIGVLYMNRGSMQYELEDYPEAVTDFDHAIRLNPQNVNAYFNRALAYEKLNNILKSIDDLSIAISIDPTFASAFNHRGGLYYTHSQYDNAIRDYDMCVKLGYLIADSYYNIGVINDLQGDIDKAVENYSKAIESEFNYTKAWVNRGIIKYNKDDLYGALTDLNQAIQLDPADAIAYFNRGLVHCKLGNTIMGIDDYTKAMELEPQDVSYIHHRASAYCVMGDDEKAMIDYNNALAIAPYLSDSLLGRGFARFRNGDIRGALIDFSGLSQLKYESQRKIDELLDLVQNQPDFGSQDDEIVQLVKELRAESILSWMLLEKWTDRRRKIDGYTEVLELNPSLKYIYFIRGEEKYRCGDYESAIADFNLALQDFPEDTEALLYRGLSRANYNDPEGAVSDFTRVLEMPVVLSLRIICVLNRGIIRFIMGDAEAAIRDFSFLIGNRSRKHAYSYFYRGIVYKHLGQLNAAMDDFNRSIQSLTDDNMDYVFTEEQKARLYYCLLMVESELGLLGQVEMHILNAPEFVADTGLHCDLSLSDLLE